MHRILVERCKASGLESTPTLIEPEPSRWTAGGHSLRGSLGGPGGAVHVNIVYASEKPNWSSARGKPRVMFLRRTTQFLAPTQPGAPGLVFFHRSSEEPTSIPVFSSFHSRYNSGNWEYMGEYVTHPAQSLSLAEWRSLPEAVSTSAPIMFRVLTFVSRGVGSSLIDSSYT